MMPGQLLKDSRLRAGITQAELARRAGTTQSAIARLEAGDRSPTVRQLAKLLALLDLELMLDVRPRPGCASLPDEPSGDSGIDPEDGA